MMLDNIKKDVNTTIIFYNLSIYNTCEYIPLLYYKENKNKLKNYKEIYYSNNVIDLFFNSFFNISRRETVNINTEFKRKIGNDYLYYTKGTLYDINKNKSFIVLDSQSNKFIYLYVNTILFSLCCKKYLCLEYFNTFYENRLLNEFENDNFILYVDKEFNKNKSYYNLYNRKIFKFLKDKYKLEKKDSILDFLTSVPYNLQISPSVIKNKIITNQILTSIFSPMLTTTEIKPLIPEEIIPEIDEVDEKDVEWMQNILKYT